MNVWKTVLRDGVENKNTAPQERILNQTLRFFFIFIILKFNFHFISLRTKGSFFEYYEVNILVGVD